MISRSKITSAAFIHNVNELKWNVKDVLSSQHYLTVKDEKHGLIYLCYLSDGFFYFQKPRLIRLASSAVDWLHSLKRKNPTIKEDILFIIQSLEQTEAS